MNRVLHAPTLDGAGRTLGAPDAAVDAFTAELLERERAAAYEQGRREGAEAARAERSEAATRAAELVTRAVAGAAAEARALREARVAADLDLALTVAAAVVGREPSDDGRALVERLRTTVSQLDDDELVVHCHPDDVALVTAAFEVTGGLRVVAESSVAAGEARVTGSWASAELTRAAAFAALRELLTEDGEIPDAG